MYNPVIRQMTNQDFDYVLELNAKEVQWTSPMDRTRLQELVSLSDYCKVIVLDQEAAGFLIAMGHEAQYSNENFAWFKARYSSFLYIDRIVIDSTSAGAGLGRKLYVDAIAHAQACAFERLVCEFNTQPLNQASAVFHERLGFVEVGRQKLEGSEKEVSMQLRDVETP